MAARWAAAFAADKMLATNIVTASGMARETVRRDARTATTMRVPAATATKTRRAHPQHTHRNGRKESHGCPVSHDLLLLKRMFLHGTGFQRGKQLYFRDCPK
jgi:hypothetical protein